MFWTLIVSPGLRLMQIGNGAFVRAKVFAPVFSISFPMPIMHRSVVQAVILDWRPFVSNSNVIWNLKIYRMWLSQRLICFAEPEKQSHYHITTCDSLKLGLSNGMDFHSYEMDSRSMRRAHLRSHQSMYVISIPKIELEAINLSLLYRLRTEFHKQLTIRTSIRVSTHTQRHTIQHIPPRPQ